MTAENARSYNQLDFESDWLVSFLIKEKIDVLQ
jgi:hypothetical protein